MTTALPAITKGLVDMHEQSIDIKRTGRFFVFEGIDGSGKTVVSQGIYKRLQSEMSINVVLTTEPTASWLGDAVRRALAEDHGPFVEAFLFAADRYVHTIDIRSWLEKGMVVLCDRYYASTLAYQGASLSRMLGNDAVGWLINLNLPFIIKPDLTFLLKIPPEVGLERLRLRSKLSKFERLEFLKEVDRIYQMLADKDESFIIIDATAPLEAVIDKIMQLIRKNL